MTTPDTPHNQPARETGEADEMIGYVLDLFDVDSSLAARREMVEKLIAWIRERAQTRGAGAVSKDAEEMERLRAWASHGLDEDRWPPGQTISESIIKWCERLEASQAEVRAGEEVERVAKAIENAAQWGDGGISPSKEEFRDAARAAIAAVGRGADR